MSKKVSEKTEKTTNTSAFGIVLSGILVMLGVALLCAAFFLLMMHRAAPLDDKVYGTYQRHYAFITDNTEKDFWNAVYEAAREEGEKENAYVERLGEDLSVDYSTSDLLRVAVNSSVDGIIFCGRDDEESIGLINRAAERGIAVVCLRQDVDNSKRQCFVGVNSYDLGLEYGNQIRELAVREEIKHPHICILVDNIAAESMQNLITLAIRDTFSKRPPSLTVKVESEETESGFQYTVKQISWDEYMPEIEIVKIDTENAFGAEEVIRDIFIDEQNLPDIMVCLNSIYTQCTYQAAVDYNRVGEVKILGYHSTGAILDAIEKRIIDSTVEVDTEAMGIQSVRALDEYKKTGYTSSYLPVRTRIIDRQEAQKRLQEAKENAAD